MLRLERVLPLGPGCLTTAWQLGLGIRQTGLVGLQQLALVAFQLLGFGVLQIGLRKSQLGLVSRLDLRILQLGFEIRRRG
jgi:hypothetical protein